MDGLSTWLVGVIFSAGSAYAGYKFGLRQIKKDVNGMGKKLHAIVSFTYEKLDTREERERFTNLLGGKGRGD